MKKINKEKKYMLLALTAGWVGTMLFLAFMEYEKIKSDDKIGIFLLIGMILSFYSTGILASISLRYKKTNKDISIEIVDGKKDAS